MSQKSLLYSLPYSKLITAWEPSYQRLHTARILRFSELENANTKLLFCAQRHSLCSSFGQLTFLLKQALDQKRSLGKNLHCCSFQNVSAPSCRSCRSQCACVLLRRASEELFWKSTEQSACPSRSPFPPASAKCVKTSMACFVASLVSLQPMPCLQPDRQ